MDRTWGMLRAVGRGVDAPTSVKKGTVPRVWGFTTPNVGDEATDSDVVVVFADEIGANAESHVFEVTSGSETVIDVGLTEEPLT